MPYNRNTPLGFLHKNVTRIMVDGLRETEPPPPVRVYRVNPDGSKVLIRVEQGQTYENMNTHRYWGRMGDLS